MAQTELLVTTRLPLEDEYTDILNKAQRGRQLSLDDLADRSGVSPQDIQTVKDGEYNADIVERLAFVLGLDAPTLQAVAEGSYYPKTVPAMPGFAMFTTRFGDMTVNAYLAWDPETKEAVSFDTGSTCEPLLDCIDEHQLTLKKLFITHTHLDHLADIHRLLKESKGTGYGPGIENPLALKHLSHGNGFSLGSLRIRVLGTSGHTPGGLSYYITGLKTSLVVVGDALFAGSMGGAPMAYEEALRNNREKILALPPETIICPGHGPLTTVGEEREHNPFFPELR